MDLATSYISWFENRQNLYSTRRITIGEFIQKNTIEYVDIHKVDIIKSIVEEIMKTGIKMKDAYHVACVVCSSYDCFLTTDDRLLRYRMDQI